MKTSPYEECRECGSDFHGASRITVRVIRTDEEQMIVRSVCRALGLGMASEKGNSDHATKHIFNWLRFRRAVSPPIAKPLLPAQ